MPLISMISGSFNKQQNVNGMTSGNAGNQMGAVPRPAWVAYSVGIVGLPVVFVCTLLWVASTPWFMTHNAYPELRGIGYGATLRQENCDIVFYGDSSSLTAYNPEIVQRITGLKACNISEGTTVTSVVGPYPLDAYLSHNKRPKYLVMMYTPSIFRPNPDWMSGSKPEGYTYLLQYVRNWRLFQCLLVHPGDTVRYASWVARQIITDSIQRLTHANPDDPARDAGAERRRRRGISTYRQPPQTYCTRTAFHYPASIMLGDPEGVAEARRKYGQGGTQVIVNVAPVPTCDELQNTYERVLAGEHDNPFERLPISWFNSQDVHFTAEGSNYLSVEAARQILTHEHRLSGIAEQAHDLQ